MTRPLVVLGATGSIGTQTLEVASALGIEVVGLAARTPSRELADIVSRHPDAAIAVAGGSAEERDAFAASIRARAKFGTDAVVEMAATHGVIVVNGIVGAAGLRATVAALRVGNRVALANKESLVAGGPVVRAELAAHGGELIPVDSEHSALHQCLSGEPPGSVRRMILTASGGPFRGRSLESLHGVTAAEALAHPTWEMGRRITVDSATMFNKGLEIIEAHHLFDIGYDSIEVVVHPQSIVHSLVEFVDGSLKAHVGPPDMRIPIQYALTAPERAPGLDLDFRLDGLELTFEAPDRTAFPALDIAYEAGRAGGSSPAAMNAADEIAVEAFLQGRLGFTGIAEVVQRTIGDIEWRDLASVDDVVAADQEARSVAAGLVAGMC